MADRPLHELVHIEAVIADNGAITIGAVGSISCIAAAADQTRCLGMLQRRPGESLPDLLNRLDAAIGHAQRTGNMIDEVNPPSGFPAPKAKKSRR